MKHRILLCTVLLTAVTLRAETLTAPLQQTTVDTPYDSGWLSNATDEAQVLVDHVVTVDRARWLRLSFSDLKLGAVPNSDETAYLRLTSEFDGAQQILMPEGARQWHLTSAYFNGDAVRVELIAPPNCGPSRVALETSTASLGLLGSLRNLCDGTDDRTLTTDARVARLLPVGCTGWLIDDANTCMLTAGHCTSSNDLDVVQFNVPPSEPSGALNHPPPSDQYVMDPDSLQINIGPIELGNDWAYYGVFPNSTTELYPYEAQNGRFRLELPQPANGEILRKTGCGTTGGQVPGTHNQATKTTTGAYVSLTGTILRFELDSSGGDSGSPVFYEGTDIAFCIHTNGGCASTGTNSACGLNNVDLQNALANPTGICVPNYYELTFIDERPVTVTPAGGVRVQIAANGRNGHVLASEGALLHYDWGNGYQTTPLESLGAGNWEIVFPPLPCDMLVSYYVSFATTEGLRSSTPLAAPSAAFEAIVADELTTIAAYDGESDAGWFITNSNVADGGWERGIPIGTGTFNEPATDYDGSGSCWLTGNSAPIQDLDGGPTQLQTPFLNLSGMENPVVTFAAWMFCSVPESDALVVEITNNSPNNFVPVATLTGTDGWEEITFYVKDYIPTPGIVRVRFSVSDNPNDSRTEAGIDAVTFYDVACTNTCIPGDTDGNFLRDGQDVAGFAAALISPPAIDSPEFCAADMDADGSLTVANDLPLLVDCLIAGNCP